MTSNLVQLSYKPGIQRDGTKFQGDMCSDGFWVRFQRGKVKKIGGMKAPNLPAYTNTLIASDISLFPYNGNIFYYIASSTRITCGEVDINFNDTENIYNNLNPVPNGANILWQSQTIINNGQRQIVFFGGNNAMDIAQNSASSIYYGNLFAEVNFTLLNNQQAGIDPLINGGMVWSNPYLFLYGSNGLVQYSANNDPFNFNIPIAPAPLAANPTAAQTAAYNAALQAYNTAFASSGGAFNISNDKVIWGRPIRGGSNSPSILFWTLSSVVRITNVGDTKADFKIDVISNSSSILSSKCVVEYDGLFFWPGTERFFVYNGIVQEMVNTTNLNYFYDNIDMNYRQKVFGVKNTKYGEIWWFYPEKVNTPGRANLPAGTNTRALIYNKRENSWYDTAIYRDCGVFSDDLGILATYGMQLTNPVANTNWLWRHEFQTAEYIENVALANLITSSYTLPVFGWSCFNPVYNIYNSSRGQPIDRWIELRRIEPNFILAPGDLMNLQIYTRTYAQSAPVMAYNVGFRGNTEKIDMRVQGRQMSLNFYSGNQFEMGTVMMLVGIGDGQ